MKRVLPAAVSLSLTLASLSGCDVNIRRTGTSPANTATQPAPELPGVTTFPACKEQLLGTLILDPKEQRRMIEGDEHIREKARQLLIPRRNPAPNLTSHIVRNEVEFIANRDQFLDAFAAVQRTVGITASGTEITIAADAELPKGSIRIDSHFDSCLASYTFAVDDRGAYYLANG